MATVGWSAEAVLAASNAWVWVPDGAPHVRTDDYLAVSFPAYLGSYASIRVFDSKRRPADLVDEVAAVARGWGQSQTRWQVNDYTRPAGLEAELMARGATPEVRLDVLALPLGSEWPAAASGGDVVEVRRVVDEAGVRDLLPLVAEAFGETLADGGPTDEQVDVSLEEVVRGLGDDSVGRVVAYVDGQPASTGGWTMAGPVCRLWGGGTRSDLRRRGAYRAVLAERLRIGTARGATLALTHGAVDTSSPILTRAGFVRYGEERVLDLDQP